MKREKAEVLFDAVSAVREDLIEAAQNYVFRKKSHVWRRYAALAACLAVVVGLGFGAARLGLLSGMGGSGSDTNGASSGAAPESGAPADGETAGSGVTTGEDAGDSAEEPVEEAVEETTFTAAVLEVHDRYLLVEPLEGAVLASADRVTVPTGDLEDLPELSPGDVVSVTFAGPIQETYPAQVTEVLSVEHLEEPPAA